jgi:hypothetical protein
VVGCAGRDGCGRPVTPVARQAAEACAFSIRRVLCHVGRLVPARGVYAVSSGGRLFAGASRMLDASRALYLARSGPHTCDRLPTPRLAGGLPDTFGFADAQTSGYEPVHVAGPTPLHAAATDARDSQPAPLTTQRGVCAARRVHRDATRGRRGG